MIHTIIISLSVVAISVYIGKTLATEKDKQNKKYKIMLDILLIIVLVILAIGLGVYIYDTAYEAGLSALN